MELAQPISALSGGARHFSRWVEGGGRAFFKLDVEWRAKFDCFRKGGRHFFKVKGGWGEAKLQPETDTPELQFKDSIAWSLILRNNVRFNLSHIVNFFFNFYSIWGWNHCDPDAFGHFWMWSWRFQILLDTFEHHSQACYFSSRELK